MTSTAAQSVSKAVATRDNSAAGLVKQYHNDFATVLPTHIKPDTWVRLALGALRRDQKLRQAADNNTAAFLGALLDAARLGLEPGSEQYYLVPRKRNGQLEVMGVPGYQGEIELMYRAGAVSSVVVEVVREKDRFEFVAGRHDRPIHEIDWDIDERGDLRLVYAYAVMKDGATSKVVVLNRNHIATARASSESAKSEYSPWNRHEEAMWLKTAVHRLKKWVPTSAEYRTTMQQAAAAALTVGEQRAIPPGNVDTESGEIVYEGEVVDDPNAPPADYTDPFAQEPAS